MDPNLVAGSQAADHFAAEVLIDLFIGIPIGFIKDCMMCEIMEQRPNRAIGKTKIKIPYFSTTEKNRMTAVFFETFYDLFFVS